MKTVISIYPQFPEGTERGVCGHLLALSPSVSGAALASTHHTPPTLPDTCAQVSLRCSAQHHGAVWCVTLRGIASFLLSASVHSPQGLLPDNMRAVAMSVLSSGLSPHTTLPDTEFRCVRH
ncbi:hypothetical protein ACOMHN_002850 [Nucella lapillus]